MHRIQVDARSGAFGVFAFEQMRDAAGEFGHFEPALDIALGVGKGLAMLGRQKPRQIVVFVLDQLEKLEHDASAALRVGGGPGREGRLRIGNRLLDLGLGGECHLGLHLAGIGVENIAKASRRALHLFAADEVADLAHGFLPGY